MKQRIKSSGIMFLILVPFLIIAYFSGNNQGVGATQNWMRWIFWGLLACGSGFLAFESIQSLRDKDYYHLLLGIVFLTPISIFLKFTINSSGGSIGWIFAFIPILYPIFFYFLRMKNPKILMITAINQLIILLMISIYSLTRNNFYNLIMALGLVVMADSFAYIFGKKYGKRKLAPLISPNKTVEGVVYSGIVSVLSLSVLSILFVFLKDVLPNLDNDSASFTFGNTWYKPIGYLGIAFFSFLASVLGDLLFSYFKRINNLKDFSSIIPGHGGLLDRIDSHSLGVPIFAALVLIL